MAFEPSNIYKGLNDKELLLRASKGDELAREEFHARHRGFLHHVCRNHYSVSLAKKLGFKEDVEDLVEVTLEKALRASEGFNDNGHTEPEAIKGQIHKWLCGIARHAFIDMWRKHPDVLVVHFDEEWEWDNHCYHDGEGDIKHLFVSPEDEVSSLNHNIQIANEALESCHTKEEIGHFFDSFPCSVTSANRKVELTLEAIEKVLSPGEQLLVYMVIDWCPEELPNWLQRDLAELLRVQKSSLRQIKRRAMRKVRDDVNSKLN